MNEMVTLIQELFYFVHEILLQEPILPTTHMLKVLSPNSKIRCTSTKKSCTFLYNLNMFSKKVNI